MDQILANRIQTPDGTILQSYNRHDYKTHIDRITGEEYMIDGGIDYIRRSVNTVPAKDMFVYADDDHDIIREAFCWGTRGKDGKQLLMYMPLAELADNHIEAILETQHQIPDFIRKVFLDEQEYRTTNNIEVK